MSFPCPPRRVALPCALALALIAPLAARLAAQSPAAKEDHALDRQIAAIAAAHHGHIALFAQNLRTGQTASLSPDLPVQTASVIKMGILLDAAEQIRSGTASFSDKLVLTKANQAPGSGVLGVLTPPITLTLRDTMMLMVVLSDNTATNMTIDRLGLDHINATLRAAGLHQTVLYKKVFEPATEPMPPDQPKFGLGKTTPRQMASIMERFARCHLALGGSAPLPGDGPLCGEILHMLRNQQDRDSLPRYLESLDTSEHGSAIANKTGALDKVRNDVALISTKAGPVVIAAFTFDNADQRWTGDNDAEKTLGMLAQAIAHRWSPAGLDAEAFPWDNPLAPPAKAAPPER
ncbi:MAG TPA: serine hydrolase [Terracidiphilus sp.]|nr:serine hydrolase [Terracidiphilus sp.]